MPFTEKTINKLRTTVDTACNDRQKDIPGTAVVVIGKDGNELFAHAAGGRGVAGDEDMTLDNVFWIASCTKMITGVACMQLVEKGLLRLDDGEQIEELCPELKTLKVLKEDGKLEDKKRRITLRMLLTHTAGFGYTFFNERLRNWGFPAGVDRLSAWLEDVSLPLLYQPGEGWEYGVGIDWAGIVIERVTGQKLNNYMSENILKPLGVEEMSMLPTEEMKSKLAHMNRRDQDGTLQPRDHILRKPLELKSREEADRFFNGGGAGMFGKPKDYCKILAMLLNDGKCSKTGAGILKPSTVAQMFTNQIPDLPDFGRQGLAGAEPELTNAIPELYPVPGNPPQGWGLTFMLSNDGLTGRSKTTAFWTGLSNCWWWCDREKGVAGMLATQILPFGDAQVLKLYVDVETEVYAGLKAANGGEQAE